MVPRAQPVPAGMCKNPRMDMDGPVVAELMASCTRSLRLSVA